MEEKKHAKPAGLTERKAYQNICAKCRRLSVWRPEFDVPARRLAKIYVRIYEAESYMAAPGFEPIVHHTNKNGSTNLAKHPIIGELTALYDQALTYERELGLTPAALKRINDAAPQKSADPFSALIKAAMSP